MKLNVFLSPVIVDELYFTNKTTVVIDVLRATSTIATALNNGAKEIVPVGSVEFAVKFSGGMFGGQTLLGGERNTKKIEGFALGNSPFEYSKDVVEGKTIVYFPTNGTKSIVKAKYSENLYTCSFLNINAVAKHLITLNTDVEIVCAGRNSYFSIEDSICAGMLVSKIKKVKKDALVNDSGTAVLTLYEKYGSNLIRMLRESDHGKILLENGFDADLTYCSSIDLLDIIPTYSNNVLKRSAPNEKLNKSV
jgi:2-phosphosulfolactate phosphatase